MEKRDAARSLSLVVSTLIFVYHAAIAYLCTYLPSDPLYVAVSVTGYAWYGCALSLLGVAGSIKRNPTLLTVFSNHLLIDTVLSLVPKIGLLYLFHDITSDLCLSSLSTSFWLPTEDSFLHGPGRVMVPSTHGGAEQYARAIKARRHCEFSISIARIIVLAVLVLWTSAQWALGLYIRRYAVRLDINDRMEQGGFGLDAEKGAGYHEDKDKKEKLEGDGYQDHVKAMQQWTIDGKSEKHPVVEITPVSADGED